MANLGQVFNQADMPVGDNNFEPIPAAWYTAKVVDAELKNTKAGNGQYINVRYEILGRSYQGRSVFGMLNIRNPNPKAESIGHQQLGDLMRAIGLASVQDTDQLVGGTCQIKVGIRPAKDGYDAQNEVKGWKAIEGSGAPPFPQAAASNPQSQSQNQQSNPGMRTARSNDGGGAPLPWAK